MREGDTGKRRIGRATRLLDADAWIDSSLYDLRFRLAEGWERVTIFFRRFRVRGWRRLAFELIGEGFTLGAAGTVVMLALAMPAFEETAGDWRAQDDYAVTFLDRYGNEIGQRGIIQRESIPVDELPDHVVKAVLATEDRRFFEHYGIDFIGLTRALSTNARANGVVQGGSTITQQLAKNLFLSNERTIERKIKEAFLAAWLEANLSKKEILQLYLDRAYMGGGTFGISAAADFYFGKNIRDVTLAEAAMLAGLFKAPTKYAPHINLPAARGRANEVLTNLVQSGFMTEGQVNEARLHPADVVDRGERESPDYFLDWAFEQVKRIAPKGVHSLVARTTIDLNFQKAAEESLEYHLRQYGKEYGASEGAIVMLDDQGAVRALVGGRDYGASQFNRATQAERQVGSSFKPYVYAVAMEKGLTPDSIELDGPVTWGNWSPTDGHAYSGRVTLALALAKSMNTVPVRLAKEKLGIKPIKALAEAMGVESPVFSDKTMVLGTSGLTVLDQATGYSVFANGGFAGSRHGILSLTDRTGKVVYDWSRDAPPPRRVLSEKAVAEMNLMLTGVPEFGTARRAQLPGIRSAGKTGTTSSFKDAWYVGFTGNYLAAVWMGNDDSTPTHNMTGGSLPAMTWQRLMAYAHQNVELKPIPGLEKPFLDPAVAEAQKPKEPTESDPVELPLIAHPAVLSSATTRLLRDFGAEFDAGMARPPAGPDTLSAL